MTSVSDAWREQIEAHERDAGGGRPSLRGGRRSRGRLVYEARYKIMCVGTNRCSVGSTARAKPSSV